MQWRGDFNAGFSTAESTWLPVNPIFVWLNMETQATSEDVHNSHIGVYRDVIRFRKQLSDPGGHVNIEDESSMLVVYTTEFSVLLNFGEAEVHFNLLEILAKREDMSGKVNARSVNGSEHNKVGSLVDLSSMKLMGKEAVLIRI